MAPKIWLSPRNVTLENVTTYFVRQMNRPLVFTPSFLIPATRDDWLAYEVTEIL